MSRKFMGLVDKVSTLIYKILVPILYNSEVVYGKLVLLQT